MVKGYVAKTVHRGATIPRGRLPRGTGKLPVPPSEVLRATQSFGMKRILLGYLGLGLLTLGAVAAETRLEIPPADKILSTLRREHPRLLATAVDFEALRRRAATEPQLQRWHTQLRADATGLLSQPPSEYEIPDGKRLLATSRRVLVRVQTLGLLWQLEGDRRWADRAWQELEAAAKFKDWNPSHFLDTAEMTHAFAIGYDWLYDAWTDAQRQVLREAIVKHGFTPGLKVYEQNSGWARARHNWNQVCNGGLGMGALALADVEPEVAGRILHAGLNSIQIAMAEFAPDGAWIEGPGYWDYATTYNFVFIAALQSALGTDFKLATFPGMDQTGWFPIYMSSTTGETFNYADSGSGAIRAPQLFWLAGRFQQPVFAWFGARTDHPHPLDLLWYSPEQRDPVSAGAPLDKYFRAAEAVTLRGSWTNANATFVGFKAGKNNDNHGHLDVGDFVLDALGERWAMDFGHDDYNLPGYFGGLRWNYYRLRAEGHNTLVVNPGKGMDQKSATTKILRFESKPNRAFAIGDLKAAVAPDARRAERGVALLDRQRVLVQDEFVSDQPADVWWFMHTEAKVEQDEAGATATLQRGGKLLSARILSPAGAKFTVMPADPLPSSPHPPKQANNDHYRKLAIRVPNAKDVQLAVLFTPLPKDGGVQTPPDKVVPLNQW
jgi:hypothetical protein